MRLFGRRGIVTARLVERARREVQRELERAGLASPRLARVRVVRPWLQLDSRVGIYRPDARGGTIAVPAVSLGRVAEYRGAAPWTSVRDILRHEYAHALADHHPALVEHASFAEAFGGAHDDDGSAAAYHPDAHVSAYAATQPSEDFAETVMLHLRVGGRIAPYRRRRGLYRKLEFVAACAQRLGNEPRSASHAARESR